MHLHGICYYLQVRVMVKYCFLNLFIGILITIVIFQAVLQTKVWDIITVYAEESRYQGLWWICLLRAQWTNSCSFYQSLPSLFSGCVYILIVRWFFFLSFSIFFQELLFEKHTIKGKLGKVIPFLGNSYQADML